jgi:hypothetical protein
MNITSVSSVESTIAYLRSLPSIRERCSRVYDLAKEGKLEYFDYHPEKEEEVVKFCAKIIEVGVPLYQNIRLLRENSELYSATLVRRITRLV